MASITSKYSGYTIISFLLCIIGIIVLIVGIALYSDKKECVPSDSKYQKSDSEKFVSFLKEVKDTYYRVHPQYVIYDPEVAKEDVIKYFYPYNPAPEKLKERTDTAKSLLEKLDASNFDLTKMKPRERKSFYQLRG